MLARISHVAHRRVPVIFSRAYVWQSTQAPARVCVTYAKGAKRRIPILAFCKAEPVEKITQSVKRGVIMKR